MGTSVINKVKKGYYNYDICKKCGGNCCKTYSGSYIPDDFNEEITFEFLDNLLKKRKTSIDWWEDSPPLYYLRPRHINECIVCGSWGGVCVHYNESDGCALSEDNRPYGCRVLKAKSNNNDCNTPEEDKGGKYGCAERWTKYQDILIKLINKYQ